MPIHRFWKADLYGKVLIGFTSMDLGEYPGLCSGVCEAAGRFTTAAFGGGADVRLSKRFSFRAFDAEYQYWPQWGNSSLRPYGVSMGIEYRIFRRGHAPQARGKQKGRSGRRGPLLRG